MVSWLGGCSVYVILLHDLREGIVIANAIAPSLRCRRISDFPLPIRSAYLAQAALKQEKENTQRLEARA